MNVIFAVEREDIVNKNEVFDKIEFFQLRFLTLFNLPSIASFYSVANTPSTLQTRQVESSINLQSNEIYSEDELVDTVTPIFNKKVVFPSLEALSLGAINSEKIWDNQLPTISCGYQNLKRLIVRGCQKLKYVFPSPIIKSFEQLQHLEIRYCKELKEIVAKEEGAEANAIFIFPQVAFLKLKDLPELTTFYPSKHTSEWPMLKKMEVCNCHRLHIFTSEYKVIVPNLEAIELHSVNSEIIWDSQLATISHCYQNLERLIVVGCEKLKFVFSSSVARFERLEHLEVRNCRVLKEIIRKGAEATPTFIFPRVTFLQLEDLPELANFYPGVHTSEWPQLKKLVVCNCDKIKIFTSEYMSFHENNKGQLDIWEQQALFLVQNINSNLEELTLSRLDDMVTLQQQFPENFFSRSAVLRIVTENEIKDDRSTNIPVGILQRLNNLEKLALRGGSYKEIFTCGEDEKRMETLVQIKSLELSNLSDVKYLWRNDFKLDVVLQNLEVLVIFNCDRMINVLPSSASFQNLAVLRVSFCAGLINIVTSSLAKQLVQLREMEIKYCRLMIEIVSNEKDVIVEDEIVFNKLKRLSLSHLECLTCFYPGKYTLNFPSLKELIVHDCPKMKSFSGGILNTPSLLKVQQKEWDKYEWCWKGDVNTTIQHMYKGEVNSNSELITLSGEVITSKWQDQFPEHQFSKVKVLQIIKDDSTHFSMDVLERFNSLEKMILTLCSYKEIFSCGEDEKCAGMLTQIKQLELFGLFNLKDIWKQDSHMDSSIQNLEMLHVDRCHTLINLVPSSTTFENLRTLWVQCCDGLINLVSSSIAKSLVRLKEMSICHCRLMTEVVSNEGDTENNEIIFDKLESLLLYNLKSLTSFCYGNYTFKFPFLEYLDVKECPNMNTFSRGVLSTPILDEGEEVWYDNENCWEGDLNTTIQHLHRKVYIQSSEKNSGQTSIKSPE
ncbi:uncharacterized protein LOC116126182 [Pistacia vera]|uniref:uncharacterized protein LOC116126182 n=1 Tax=Pistacia vera TaxID=55513 RepID=UPI00126352ED|nr:uncharacterized protein LOC116126182 [Pistacia vera]XP_031267746.1 uncharacterized protein LOC116126182 [Pistacia vera]